MIKFKLYFALFHRCKDIAIFWKKRKKYLPKKSQRKNILSYKRNLFAPLSSTYTWRELYSRKSPFQSTTRGFRSNEAVLTRRRHPKGLLSRLSLYGIRNLFKKKYDFVNRERIGTNLRIVVAYGDVKKWVLTFHLPKGHKK